MNDNSGKNSPESDDQKIIPGHEYDGIKELDNPLPGWWLVTFFGTIIFAFMYYIHYTFSGAPNLKEELKQDLAQMEADQKSASGASGASSSEVLETEDELSQLIAAADSVTKGKQIFSNRCSSCHGEAGGGLVGPNLTDAFWIHGKGTRVDILSMIRNGYPDKGMPGWKDILKKNETYEVLAYVYSLRNTNIPGGKSAQGQEVK